MKTRNGVAPFLFIIPIASTLLWLISFRVVNGTTPSLRFLAFMMAILAVSIPSLVFGLLNSMGRWLSFFGACAYSVIAIGFDGFFIYDLHSHGYGYLESIFFTTGIPTLGMSSFTGMTLRDAFILLPLAFLAILIIALPLATLLLALNHSKKVKAQIL